MISFKEQRATLLTMPSALDMAEYAARMCYNSSRPQREDYDRMKFLKSLANRGHLTPFEHGWLSIPIGKNNEPVGVSADEFRTISRMSGRARNEVIWDGTLGFCVASLRTYIEVLGVDEAFNIFQKYDERDTDWYSFEIITSRAIGNQLIRHRSLSFENTWELPEFSINQESLRWVPQGEASVCIGKGYKAALDENPGMKQKWIHSINQSFEAYRSLCESYKKEFARTVLPLCTTTRIMMTGNGHTWVKFLELRLEKGAEPQMRELALDIFNQLKDKLTLDDGYDADREPFKTVLAEGSCI